MAIRNAQELAQALIDAAVAAYEAGLDGDSETEAFIHVDVRVPLSIASVVRGYSMGQADDGIGVEPFCRICGCTWNTPCDGGCSWVEPDLCSACVPKVALLIPQRVEATNG